jgi:hypothetical protein
VAVVPAAEPRFSAHEDAAAADEDGEHCARREREVTGHVRAATRGAEGLTAAAARARDGNERAARARDGRRADDIP